MSADSVPSSKTNIFQSKLYTLVYCRHFKTYSRCAMFDWSDTVFRRRNVTHIKYRITAEVLRERSGLARSLPIGTISEDKSARKRGLVGPYVKTTRTVLLLYNIVQHLYLLHNDFIQTIVLAIMTFCKIWYCLIKTRIDFRFRLM